MRFDSRSDSRSYNGTITAFRGLPVPSQRASGVHGTLGTQLQPHGMQWADVQVTVHWDLSCALMHVDACRWTGRAHVD